MLKRSAFALTAPLLVATLAACQSIGPSASGSGAVTTANSGNAKIDPFMTDR